MSFLRALQCKNEGPPPVWLMRQAGRTLPEYRAYRKKYTLHQLFHNPELAAQITKLPLDILGVDAAILFSDILVVVEALDKQVIFQEGSAPQIFPKISTKEDIEALKIEEVEKKLSYVAETIKLLKKELTIPLIGFCAAPFTLATYLMDNVKRLLFEDPVSFHLLMRKLTDLLKDYIEMQINAGVDAFQIFDTWAIHLGQKELEEANLPYMKELVDTINRAGSLSIIFAKGISFRAKTYATLGSHCLSVDNYTSISQIRKEVGEGIALQGNLDPMILHASRQEIEGSVEDLMQEMQRDRGFVVNLGHGLLPDVPIEQVKLVVDHVRISLNV